MPDKAKGMGEMWHRIRTTGMGGSVAQDTENGYGRKCGAG